MQTTIHRAQTSANSLDTEMGSAGISYCVMYKISCVLDVKNVALPRNLRAIDHSSRMIFQM